MKKHAQVLSLVSLLFVVSCQSNTTEPTLETADSMAIIHKPSPNDMLREAYQLFKEGNDPASIELASTVLEIGRETDNDTLIGGALTSLCRNAQRSLDTTRLTELSDELVVLSESSGDQKWLMYRAHMNAEMWRLIGDMERAEAFYDESMRISHEIGSMGMYTIDHFNKSFVSTAKGDFEAANLLIKRYYELREEQGQDSEDAYGLIALAYLLVEQKNYEGAHEVAVVTRRLFKTQNLFPEPPDEKPLLAVEEKVKEALDESKFNEIASESESKTVSDLLKMYLK
jgi:tetratricopeptide (TPR) repeat protein